MGRDTGFKAFAFFVFSALFHVGAVFALILSGAGGGAGPKGHESIEVAMSDAPKGEQMETPVSAPAPAPVVAKPAPKAQPKPTVQKPKSEPKAVMAAAVVPTEGELPKKESPPAQEEQAQQEELTPVQETAPAGVVAATSEEEAVTEVEQPQAEAVTTQEEPKAEEFGTEDGTAAAAGAGTAHMEEPTTAEGIADTRSYLDLKQKPGNRAPDYPIEARRTGRQGDVELMYLVTKDGRVDQIKVVKSSGSEDLDAEAIKTIAQYRFVPGQEGWTRHPVQFSLKGQTVQMPSRLRTMGAQGR